MKKKRIMKLLSLSMAGILLATSCNLTGTGNVVYAEEKIEGKAESEPVSEETEEGAQEDASKEAVTEPSEAEKDETLQEDSTETTEQTESETQETEEAETEESETEETETETLETALEAVNLLAETEDVVLTQFYGSNVTFDSSSTWSDAGESQLGLTSQEALGEGARISFDIYIPQDMTDYEGIMKIQGVARLGDDWLWTENSSIPEFAAADFDKLVMVDDTVYAKAGVTFTFGEEIEADYLANFTVKLAGYLCNYDGPVYYGNVKLTDGEAQEKPDTQENILKKWSFENGTEDWSYGDGWEYQYSGADNSSVFWAEEYQALGVNVDYSADANQTWSQMAVTYYNEAFTAENANKISFDFIYDSAKLNRGSFQVKIFSNSGLDSYAAINLENAQEYDGSLKKVPFAISFDAKELTTEMAVCIIGNETDYTGALYLDNITVSSEEAGVVDDIYVNSTKNPTGQEVLLAVDGNSLITGTGTAGIAESVTLVDANAQDCVKQIYAYLQAVGNTQSVIFGQQNNTHHKAGSAELSCSDTMDVVGSYAGVIGMDTLSLVGDEYSASRYASEMNELDSEYNNVMAAINQAATTAEKNVIAAAALTNYNIRNGAIITLSAHIPNFSIVNKVAADETAPSYAKYNFNGYSPNNLNGDVMNQLLPGGAYNEVFRAYLDMVADYAKRVDGAILFRPFHENTGSWFWWGAAFCDAQTYKSVFKYTVEYLRDEKDIHNMLYEYGPGSEAANMNEYELRYPGDGYVDLVGFDMYHDAPTADDSFISNFTKQIAIVDGFAKAHNKLFAITETGVKNATAAGDNQTALLKSGNSRLDWFKEVQEAAASSSASYLLVWANFGEKDGFYTPYVKNANEDGSLYGHEMLDHFIEYFNTDNSVFAVNQKAALEQLKGRQIQANPASRQEGYIVSPVAGSRVLEETMLAAKVTGALADSEVTFVCHGKDASVTLPASMQNGYYYANLNAEALAELGEAVGSIDLAIDGTKVDEIGVTFNIQAPEADPYEIDGFENYYGVDSMLTKAWTTNKASGSTITISLTDEKKYEGNYAMKFAYEETTDGWAGATVSKEVSWADCNALSLWTIPDGNLQKTVIQITANGNVYEYYPNLNEDYAAAGTTPVLMTIPFSEFAARDITGNPTGGLNADSSNIASIGLWVNAIAGSSAVDENNMVSGTIYYDSITAVTTDSTEVVVKKLADEEEKPQEEPSQETGNAGGSSSEASSQSGSVTVQAPANVLVQPTYIGADGKKVSGWEAVTEAAYQNAMLQFNQVPLAEGIGEAAASRATVDINIVNVTDMVIPQSTVLKMAATGADYNLYGKDVVITLTNEVLSGMEGVLDLMLYTTKMENFGAGFDAISIMSRTPVSFVQPMLMNAFVPVKEAQKPVFIFGKTLGSTEYELISQQEISSLGTICFPIKEGVDVLVLY